MIPMPGFIYKISFLKKWENLHHYWTFFERTHFRILLFVIKYLRWKISIIFVHDSQIGCLFEKKIPKTNGYIIFFSFHTGHKNQWNVLLMFFSPLKCFSGLLFLPFSLFLSFSVSSLFCIRPIYVKFHVIYQVKGISRYVWGVCGCV